MRGQELAVEQLPAARDQPRDEMRERDLRRVARAADHRFAEKGASERHAIEAADEAVPLPAFDAVRMAEAKEPRIARLDQRVDPRGRAVGRGLGAQRHHPGEGGVGGDAKAVGNDDLFQAARQAEPVQGQDRAQPRLDPMHRRVVGPVGHREQPLRIGAEQQRGVDRVRMLRQLAGFTNFSVMRSDSPIARYLSLSASLFVSVGGSVHTPFS